MKWKNSDGLKIVAWLEAPERLFKYQLSVNCSKYFFIGWDLQKPAFQKDKLVNKWIRTNLAWKFSLFIKKSSFLGPTWSKSREYDWSRKIGQENSTTADWSRVDVSKFYQTWPTLQNDCKLIKSTWEIGEVSNIFGSIPQALKWPFIEWHWMYYDRSIFWGLQFHQIIGQSYKCM